MPWSAHLAIVGDGDVVLGAVSDGGTGVAVFVNETPRDRRVHLPWQLSPTPGAIR